MKLNQKGVGLVGVIMAVVVLAAVGAGGWYVGQGKDDKPAEKRTTQTQSNHSSETGFADPVKSAHFESSTPEHASTLAAVPPEIVLNFNFDLHADSTIKIEKDGKDYGVVGTSVDANKLGLRRKMDSKAPDGIYSVNYKACWPDRTCHEGSFQFKIDRGQINSYQDMRGQKAITVKLSDIKFQPMNLRISAGTTVTWVNDDSVEHYVNTDSHPAHSHVPDFNSRALAKGASYSYTFHNAGAYPYHCSAHAADMHGSIVVES